MLIINKKSFGIGAGLLISFFIVFAIFMSPVLQGQTIISYADQLFNSLTKGSVYSINKVIKSCDKLNGKTMNVSVTAKSKNEADTIAKIVTTAGGKATINGMKVKVTGDLGKLGKVAATNADALYKNNPNQVSSFYGIDGKTVVYYWESIFNAEYKQDLAANKPAEMNFANSITTKALEPAYNFEGMQAESVSSRTGVTSFMLIFYVVYTIWYGFAIMFLFEGLGITAKAGKKAEA